MILAGGHAGAGPRWPASGPRPRRSPRLQHPNIVQVYEVGEHDGLPYFAMEFVAGGSLADRLAGTPAAGPAKPPPWSPALARRRSQRAHADGIVHRDLKPANVLLGIANAEC